MSSRQKKATYIAGAFALLGAVMVLPYYLYVQGSPMVMENIHFFIAAFLAAIAIAMRVLGIGSFVGLAFMSLGVAMLVMLHLFGLTFSNRLLLISIGLVLLGLVLHVWAQKRKSRY